MYEIRMSAGNNLKAWYEGLVGGSDSAAMYVVVYRDKCMINFALQHCTSYLLNLICRCVCVCVGWKKVKQDFEELYKAQVWPVTLLCFGLRSDNRFIHFPGIKQRPHRCISVVLFCCVRPHSLQRRVKYEEESSRRSGYKVTHRGERAELRAPSSEN